MTQYDRIIKHLKRNTRKGLTSMEAFVKLGIVNLHGRLSELRRQGYHFRTRREEGNGTWFLRVWLA